MSAAPLGLLELALDECVLLCHQLTALMGGAAAPYVAQYTFVNRSRLNWHLVSPKFPIFCPGLMASGLLLLPYFGD
jgi:hypothetical protein